MRKQHKDGDVQVGALGKLAEMGLVLVQSDLRVKNLRTFYTRPLPLPHSPIGD